MHPTPASSGGLWRLLHWKILNAYAYWQRQNMEQSSEVKCFTLNKSIVLQYYQKQVVSKPQASHSKSPNYFVLPRVKNFQTRGI